MWGLQGRTHGHGYTNPVAKGLPHHTPAPGSNAMDPRQHLHSTESSTRHSGFTNTMHSLLNSSRTMQSNGSKAPASSDFTFTLTPACTYTRSVKAGDDRVANVQNIDRLLERLESSTKKAEPSAAKRALVT